MSPDPAATIDELVVFDISLMLAKAIDEVRAAVQAGDIDTPVYLLSQWDQALGDAWRDIARAVGDVRGRRGYGATLAKFSLEAKWRRPAVAQLHQAISVRSRRKIDRWKWIATAYRADVERFTGDQALSLSNREAKGAVVAATDKPLLRSLPVLRAIADQRHKLLSASEQTAPELGAYALLSLARINHAASHCASMRRQEIHDRDAALERAAKSVAPAQLPADVAAMPSAKAQTAAYTRLRLRAERDQERILLVDQLKAVRTSLNELAKLTASIVRPLDPETKVSTSATAGDSRGKTRRREQPPPVTTDPVDPFFQQLLDHADRMLESALPEEALADLDRLVAYESQSPLSLLRRGLLRDHLGYKEQALSDCRAASESGEQPYSELAIVAGICIAGLFDQIERADAAVRDPTQSSTVDRITLRLLKARYQQFRTDYRRRGR